MMIIDELLQKPEELAKGYSEIDGNRGIYAQAGLKQFYLERGVTPDIADEFSKSISGHALLGLRTDFTSFKINPTLRELINAFEGLVAEGYDHNAAAILLSDGYFRAVKTGLIDVIKITNAQNLAYRIEMAYKSQNLTEPDGPTKAARYALSEIQKTYSQHRANTP